MSLQRKTGKECIQEARRLAKLHGVDVLGWSDKEGEETINMNGDGDRLVALQKDMEKEGWHTWPVEEAAEGFFMDFGMQPAPADWASKNALSKESDEPALPYTGTNFHYRGFTDSFIPYITLVGSILCIAIGYPSLSLIRSLNHADRLPAVIAGIIIIILISIALVAVFDWTDIFADKSTLRMNNKWRNVFLKQPRDIPLSNIKKAKIYRTNTGNSVSNSLIIRLKSGKAIELFLPKKVRGELATFLKNNI